jgi:ATP-binding cassette, subfamily B, bacterial
MVWELVFISFNGGSAKTGSHIPFMTTSSSRWAVYRRTLRYYAPYKRAILIALFFDLLTIGTNLLKPWPLKYVLDGILSDKEPVPLFGPSTGNISVLLYLCIALVLIHLAWGLLNRVKSFMQVKIGLDALLRLRCDLFAHLQRLSLKYHDSKSSADSMYRVSYDAQAVQSIFNKGFSGVFTAAMTLIWSFAIMLSINWALTLVALCIVPFLLWSIYFFADRIRRYSTDLSAAESALTSRTQEGLSGIRIVHAFGREDYEIGRFQEQAGKSLRANLQLNLTHVNSAVLIGTLMAFGNAAMIYFGGRSVLQSETTSILGQPFSPGDLIVFISYLGYLYDPLQTLSYTAWALEGSAAGALRAFEILDTPEDVKDRPEARKLETVKGRISMENISFGYDSNHPILKNVSLDIPAGSAVAFVGATGAGKTTLLSLVPRFYDPAGGSVKFDGVDIREYQKRSLRDHIGIVLQDTMLLAGTIRENIAYGRLGASGSEIEEAAKMARVHDFVSQMPKGYDTEVGERGIRLSVGQRQRIGIARAFLKNAPILLLDEPTSALDPETEAGLMETLRKLMEGRTTVIVTHRIATVHRSDRIFVLERGALIETGSGEELLGKNGAYARLYHAQVKK